MTNDTPLSRRRVLTMGATTVGFLTLAGGAIEIASGSVDYNQRLLQTNGDIDLEVDWAEFYNGQQLEAQDTAISRETQAPIITLENILPGDSGRVAFGLRTAEETPAQLQLLFRLVDEAENSITEPESRAGDTSLNSGELPEYVQVRGWYDSGVDLAGSTIYGACDGEFEDLGEEIQFEGTLAGALGDSWRPIDANPASEEDACLGPDEGLCFAIEWELPEDLPGVEDNIIQNDSVTFELGFRGAVCGE